MGMMLQAALLLDEMADVEQFLNKLVTYAYLPQFEGWICPEGIIVHRDGELYLPVNGYLGQDSHLADATKALRVMLGFDDNDPGQLRLVPRYPDSWKSTSVERFPVLTGSTRQLAGYSYQRTDSGQRFSYSFEWPVENLSVRLGPLSSDSVKVTVNGAGVPVVVEKSGDSLWAWVTGLHEKTGEIELCVS